MNTHAHELITPGFPPGVRLPNSRRLATISGYQRIDPFNHRCTELGYAETKGVGSALGKRSYPLFRAATRFRALRVGYHQDAVERLISTA
jgi:hypothetical protein